MLFLLQGTRTPCPAVPRHQTVALILLFKLIHQQLNLRKCCFPKLSLDNNCFCSIVRQWDRDNHSAEIRWGELHAKLKARCGTMCFCSAVSGLHRLWCQALLKLAALSDAVRPAFLSPIWTLNRQWLKQTNWKLCRAEANSTKELLKFLHFGTLPSQQMNRHRPSCSEMVYEAQALK